MPITIINNAALGAGDAVLWLPECSGAGLVPYNRVSSWGQAGKGKSKLAAKDAAFFDAVRAVAPGRVRHVPISGVEEGRLSNPRPKLLEAAEYAKRRRLILVASDLSRFIRAEAYDRRKNPEAKPTPEEFAQLREMTGGVVLATLEPPTMTEAERQSRATKRTGQCGRKSAIMGNVAIRILNELGMWHERADGRIEWETPIATVAKRNGVSPSAIKRVLDEVNPHDLNDPPLRWKDYMEPARAYRKALKLDEHGSRRGLMRRGPKR